jgi:hypothetical protein
MTDMRQRMSDLRSADPIWPDAFKTHYLNKPEVRHWMAEQTAEFQMRFETAI